jgi:hypothetical protein
LEDGIVNTSSNSHYRAKTRLLSIAIILSSLASAPAQGSSQRIRFARGHSSTTLSGRIAGFDTKDYVVGASAGQEDDCTFEVIELGRLLRHLLDQRTGYGHE